MYFTTIKELGAMFLRENSRQKYLEGFFMEDREWESDVIINLKRWKIIINNNNTCIHLYTYKK